MLQIGSRLTLHCLVVTCLLCHVTISQDSQYYSSQQKYSLADYFAPCHRSSRDFDACVLQALNQLNYLFPTGVPEYDIPPLDPFFAREVVQKRSGPLLNYRLRLLDVFESGWTDSTVNAFKSDLTRHKVTVQQTWTDKRLWGDYVFEGTVLGSLKLRNKGKFNLTLYGFNQTTTLTRPPGEYDENGAPLIKVNVQIQGVRDLKLHITNLLNGHRVFEYALDSIINASWRPFYPLTKPLVNDLVSTAFTPIFTKAFRNVPLDVLFPE